MARPRPEDAAGYVQTYSASRPHLICHSLGGITPTRAATDSHGRAPGPRQLLRMGWCPGKWWRNGSGATTLRPLPPPSPPFRRPELAPVARGPSRGPGSEQGHREGCRGPRRGRSEPPRDGSLALEVQAAGRRPQRSPCRSRPSSRPARRGPSGGPPAGRSVAPLLLAPLRWSAMMPFSAPWPGRRPGATSA
jgi:hypothetical protein